MKKVRLVAVGSIKEEFFLKAIEEYVKRLQRFCSLTIIEVEESSIAGGIEREAEGILRHLSGTVILFDVKGKMLSSPEFSDTLSKAYTFNGSVISLIIGGSNGVSDKVKKAAHHIVSFGKITYPHRLMRVIALEQIYRAFTISEGLPYHK